MVGGGFPAWWGQLGGTSKSPPLLVTSKRTHPRPPSGMVRKVHPGGHPETMVLGSGTQTLGPPRASKVRPAGGRSVISQHYTSSLQRDTYHRARRSVQPRLAFPKKSLTWRLGTLRTLGSRGHQRWRTVAKLGLVGNSCSISPLSCTLSGGVMA